jgi:hypothetical protein
VTVAVARVATRNAAARLAAINLGSLGAIALVILGLGALAFIVGLSVIVSPLAPLALAVGALLCYAMWLRPVLGAVVVAALAPALAGLARGVGLPGLKLSELLVVAAAGVCLLRRPARWRAMGGVDAALGLFALTTIGLAAYHLAAGHVAMDVYALVAVQPAFLFMGWWVASRGIESRQDVALVLKWVLLISTVPAALAILQYLDVLGVRSLLDAVTGNPDEAAVEAVTSTWQTPESPGSGVRVTGPFTIWHSLGGYLLLPTVLATILLLRGGRAILPRPVLAGILALDLSAVVLSVTVTLIVWLPVAVLVAALLARVLLKALAAVLVLGVAATIVFSTAINDRVEQQTAPSAETAAVAGSSAGGSPAALQTLQYRVLVWQRDYLPVVGRAAAVGVGTDTPQGVIFTSTENQNLTYLLRGGIVLVAVAWVGVGALTVRAVRHARHARGPARAAAQSLVGVLAFMPLSTMVWPYLSNAGLSYLLVGFAGAALAIEPGSRDDAEISPDEQSGARVTPGRTEELQGAH